MTAASVSKQCKPMKTYIESLCCRERNDIPDGTSKVIVSR